MIATFTFPLASCCLSCCSYCKMYSAKEASMSLNEFSFKFYAKLCNDKAGENLFLSPTSIFIALAMTYAGTKGSTAKQMEAAMNWNTPGKVHEMMKELQESLLPSSDDSGVELKLANRLWAQSGFAILQEYTRILQSCYQAEMGEVDYETKTEEARQAINDWIARKTNDKIMDLLQQGVLTTDTRLVLTNAVYFKGFWQNQFDEASTHDWDFKISKKKTTKVSLMEQTCSLLYAEDEALSFQVVEIPYKKEKLAMMIFLPKEIDGLRRLEEQLSPDVLRRSGEMMSYQEVVLSLPKFKLECQLKLNDALKQLGISELFSRSADLSGITGEKELYLSDAIHQAFVDVNEEGTEAAAATAMVKSSYRMMSEEEPPHFLADHPFLFVIKHLDSGAILFMGRLTKP